MVRVKALKIYENLIVGFATPCIHHRNSAPGLAIDMNNEDITVALVIAGLAIVLSFLSLIVSAVALFNSLS